MKALNFQAVRAILESCPVGMLLTNAQGTIVYHNIKAANIFKYREISLIGRSIEDLIPAKYHHRHEKLREEFKHYPVAREMSDNRVLPGLNADGEEFPVRVGLCPLSIESGIFTLVTVLECPEEERISQLERINRQLEEAATHDYLTGLSNRRLFIELGEKLLSLAARHCQTIALIFIDLDNFKQVNDSHGHAVGDRLLIRVADTLTQHVRKSDVVSRIGGDEFLICLNELRHEQDIQHISNGLLNDIAAIDDIDGRKVNIGASIGVLTVQAREDMELLPLVEQADGAMYRAKSSGKGRIVYIDHNDLDKGAEFSPCHK